MSLQIVDRPTETLPPGVYVGPSLEATEAETHHLNLGDGDWKDTDANWRLRPEPQAVYQRAVSRRFQRLADQWLKDTINISSVAARVAHSAYLEIIGMGERAIPLLLSELERRPSHWFPALTAITGENPIPKEARGRFEEMKEAWLEWGRKNNYI